MDNEITIKGVTYIRKDALPNSNFKFNPMCQYFTYHSCNPDVKLRDMKLRFPEMNSFFVGKKGYRGKVCLEVDIDAMSFGFFKRLLPVSGFHSVIEDEKSFKAMIDEEMSKPDLH